MNGRQRLEEQARDLAAINRHHDKRMRWLLAQISDEELKRLGLDEPNRNSNDWEERVLHTMDVRLDRFMNAHNRLRGHVSAKAQRTKNFLDRFQATISMHLREEVKRAAQAAIKKINSGMRE